MNAHCEHNSFLGAVLKAMLLAAILILFGWIIAIPLALVFYLFARNQGFAAALDRSATVMKGIGALMCWGIVILLIIWLAKDFAPIFSDLGANIGDLFKLIPHVVQAMVN